jgi:cation diffusion facilitator family transporter
VAELLQEQPPACAVHEPPQAAKSEARTRWVVVLTVVMMIAELVAGYLTNSMALTADGWHMATHVGALGLTAAAYWYARTRAGETRFAFGTGKVYALAGYTSAVFLLAVSGWVAYESLSHLMQPELIKFGEALPVAVVGLIVNLASAALLNIDGHSHDHAHADGNDHPHEHEHAAGEEKGHGHTHEQVDHNLKAAYLHVMADALTSLLAIVALVAGRFFAVPWLDAAVGIVGSVMIARWGISLTAECARQLIDLHPVERDRAAVQAALEKLPGTRVSDLHLWSVGPGRLVCVVAVNASPARPLEEYRTAVLAAAPIAHLTIEVR